MNKNRLWTKEEEILALYAYCNIPFNKASNTTPLIVRIAQRIARTPASVKMKIGNFGAFDPQLKARGITGLTNVAKLDAEVWNMYYGHWDKLATDAASIIARISTEGISEIAPDLPLGTTITATVQRRIHQDFFRNVVLSSYNNTCCISGITEPRLLEACHIVSWAENEAIRTDPTNGLCMNPLFHRAYDQFLISISADFILKISDSLLDQVADTKFQNYLLAKNNSTILLPDRFVPSRDYLDQHHQKYCQIYA